MFASIRQFNRYPACNESLSRLRNTLLLMFVDSAHSGFLVILPASRFSAPANFVVPIP
jgi:hypothetical protein